MRRQLVVIGVMVAILLAGLMLGGCASPPLTDGIAGSDRDVQECSYEANKYVQPNFQPGDLSSGVLWTRRWRDFVAQCVALRQ
jgi:hypothetical protein